MPPWVRYLLAVASAFAVQFALLVCLNARVLLCAAPGRRFCNRRHQYIADYSDRHSVVKTHGVYSFLISACCFRTL